MKYWFIIHSLPAYFAHSDYIGKEKNRSKKIEGLLNIPIHDLIINFLDLYIFSSSVDSSKLSDMYKRYSEEVIQCFRDKSSIKTYEPNIVTYSVVKDKS